MRGGAGSARPERMGTSMSSVLAAAMTTATPTRARFRARLSAPRAMGTSTRMGQCQRYSEYEMRPIQRGTRIASTRLGSVSAAPPPMMARAVPTTGMRAAVPG